MLESKIIGITLEVFATVLAHIRVVGYPLLQQSTLLFFGKIALISCAQYLCYQRISVLAVVYGSWRKAHLVDLCISRNIHKVVSTSTIAIHIAIHFNNVWRTTTSLINQTDSGLPLLACTVTNMVVSTRLNTMRNIVCTEAEFWVVRISIGSIKHPVTTCHRRSSTVHTHRTCPCITCHQIKSEVEMLFTFQR